jgi:hypothetical protein
MVAAMSMNTSRSVAAAQRHLRIYCQRMQSLGGSSAFTLNLFSAVMRNFVFTTGGSKEVFRDNIIPVDVIVDLGHVHDGMEVLVSLYDCLLLRTTTSVETE